MNRYRMIAGLRPAYFVAASILGLSAISAEAQNFGPASDYNLFVFGNINLQNSDTEGRVAAGGNATFTNYGIGNKLPANTGIPSLVVGGNLNSTNMQVNHGNVAIGGSLTGSVSVPNGAVVSGSPVDFGAAEAQLDSLSASLSGLSVNGTYQNNWGSLQFTGTDADLNVFLVQASDLGSAHGISINAPSGSTVIINVAGSSADWKNMGISISGTDRSRVLYNFADATSLNISGISVQGAVLAPHAAVIFNNGNVEGTFVSQSISGTGEFHYHPLQANLVPEPASLTLAAFGGLLLFRRRREIPVR